jgi:gallate decarboxylase subunit D
MNWDATSKNAGLNTVSSSRVNHVGATLAVAQKGQLLWRKEVAGYSLTWGKGRTRLKLTASHLGDDLVVCIFNVNAHIGAVSLSEWDSVHLRASTSLITRLGHKDDSVAQAAAYKICKTLQRPVCVIAGIHLDDITPQEIKEFGVNSASIVDAFLEANQKH